jgi:hypothetical protein
VDLKTTGTTPGARQNPATVLAKTKCSGGTVTKTEWKQLFPWLGTDQKVNGAEVIAQLNALYLSAPAGKASSEWARKLSGRRKTHSGGGKPGQGRPATFVNCPECGATDTKTRMRRHHCITELNPISQN